MTLKSGFKKARLIQRLEYREKGDLTMQQSTQTNEACPVCGSHAIQRQRGWPALMECLSCKSEWVEKNKEVLYNSREEF